MDTEPCLITPQGNMAFSDIESLKEIQKAIGGEIVQVPKRPSTVKFTS
jgi:hypothetical protein